MAENLHTKEDLRQRQALPLEAKISMTHLRIRQWYNYWCGDVCVSFSGGKDSTVLLHLVRQMYPDVKAIFVNTGLEYPEIQQFVRTFDNVDIVRPDMRFDEVISKYGYPLISKEVSQTIYEARRYKALRTRSKFDPNSEYNNRYKGTFDSSKYLPLCNTPIPITHICCKIIKKDPSKEVSKKRGLQQIVATMAEESALRTTSWLKHGCNAFNSNTPKSMPMSFWTGQDVLRYAVENNIEFASVYGDIVAVDEDGNQYDPHSLLIPDCKLKCTGCDRTGCIFCAFGFHSEKGETRFQRLARTHPRQYEYCMSGGQWVDNPAYDPTAPKIDGAWQNWNPKKIWVPSKQGLGMKKVFDMVNEIYGKDFYRYE